MNSQGGIIRTVKDREHPYRTMNISVLQDNRLSLEARGLLGYLLSKPDDWEVRFTDLLTYAGPNCKEDRLRRILKELESFGYIQRTRKNVAHGKFEWVTTVFETPQTESTIMVKSADGTKRIRKPKSPSADFPHMAPYADSSIMDKPADIHSNDSSLPKGKGERAKRVSPSPEKKKETTPIAIIQVLADVCVMDRSTLTKQDHIILAEAAGALYQAGKRHEQTDEQIADAIRWFGKWFKTGDFRGQKGEAPTPALVRRLWKQAHEARKTNGHSSTPLTATKPKIAPDAQPSKDSAKRMLELLQQQRGK
jgi:hypothetical protein